MTYARYYFRLLCCAMVLACRPGPVLAAEEEAETDASQQAERIFEEAPHDELKLKDGTVIKVETIKFPNRKVPERPRPQDKLVVHLLDKPDEAYEVAWRDVAEVRLFEKRVLGEAEQLVAAGEIDKAYDYFDFLEQNYPAMPGLPEAMQKYLYQDAQAWQRRKQYDYVLALLDQLYVRNPKFAGLDRALGIVTDKLIEAKLAKGDYPAAHALLRSLEKKFPQDPQVGQLQQKLQAQADATLKEAEAALAADHLRQGQQLCRKALEVWPKHEQARAVYAKSYQAYPCVAVGVTEPLVSQQLRLDNWAAARVGRLVQVPLAEFTGYGNEGRNYFSPVGSMEETDLGLRLMFRLRPGARWSDGSPLTGFDISRTLLDSPGSDTSRFAPWADLIERIDVSDVYTAAIRFKQAPVHAEALFATPIVPGGQGAALGLFKRGEQTAEQTVYVASNAEAGRTPQTPREIVERNFGRGRDAVEALRRRDIAMIDRLNPWDVEALREMPDVAVEAYAVPALHCLLPNTTKPLLANRVFRRALLYAIHRVSILDVQLLRGRAMPGARVVSGPFPSGYAYNDEVEVRPYEPRVAMMLASVALAEIGSDEKRRQAAGETSPDGQATSPKPSAGPARPETGQERPTSDGSPGNSSATNTPPCPTLVLAHPADDVARLACRTIERQLKLVKIPIRLVELKPGEIALAGGEYDLVYAELRIPEPLVDVGRLFGPAGLVPLESAYLRAALDRLAGVTDWKSAREMLLQIHKIVADELPILPLYQLPEYFAYRRTIKGIGSQPATLYQNIGQWQTEPDMPAAQ